MKKTLLFLFVLALVVVSLSGVVSGQTGSIRIALIAKSEANFVFLSARRGAVEKAEALSKAHGVPIEISWLTPTKEDAAQQAERIRQAVREKASAILLAASDGPALAPVVDEAVAAGVEVMTFDSDVPGSKRFAFYGADDTDLGEKVAADLVSLLGGKGEVAILAGSPNAGNLRARSDAVKKALTRAGIEVAGVVNHVETPHEAVAAMLRMDAERPQLTGWALVGGWPLFRSSQTPALMAELQKRAFKVVAVDALPEQLVYVERGLVPVLWAQPVYDWGAIGVSTIVDKLLLKKTVPRNIRMELIRVTRDDIRAYARRLNSWGFTVPKEYLSAS